MCARGVERLKGRQTNAQKHGVEITEVVCDVTTEEGTPKFWMRQVEWIFL